MPFCAYCVQISTTFLRVGDRRLLGAFELDVRLDELDRAVGAGRHRLRRGAGEPVDDRAAGDEAEQERRVEERQLAEARGCRPLVSATMIEKIIVVAPTTAVPMSTGLAVALNVLPAPSFSSRKCLAFSKLGVEAEVLLDLLLDVGDGLDERQLVDRLRVVGDRAVGVDRDGHRAHAEEAEGDEAEGEDRRRVIVPISHDRPTPMRRRRSTAMPMRTTMTMPIQ